MHYINRSSHLGNLLLLFIFSFLSVFCFLLLITDNNRPVCYESLCILPLSFTIFSWIFYKIYFVIPSNMGISLIVILYFVRDVLSPLVMYMGDYNSTISVGINENTIYALFLVVYENLIVFACLYFCVINNANSKVYELPNYKEITKKGKRIYVILVITMLIVLTICIHYTPQLLISYRPITEINDQHFANMEDGYIVKKYGTSFSLKLSLVIGNYIMRIALLIVPATLIVLIHNFKNNRITKYLALIICFFPFLYIGGAIGRSLIYTICLILLRDSLYNPKSLNKHIVFVAMLGFIAIIVYWTTRDLENGFDYTGMSKRFSSYFSSVNIVSGVYNLPRNIEYRFRYFIFDYITTLPFGNTIFGTAGETTVQPFFNMYNDSQGQIPPTIAMGYYYFGSLLAPVYSVLFSLVAFRAGEKIRCKDFDNPFQFARLMYTIFTFSMGIIMYNIEITMTNTLCILLPMAIMEKIAYEK